MLSVDSGEAPAALVSYLSSAGDCGDTQVDTLVEEPAARKGGSVTPGDVWAKLIPLWGKQVPLLLAQRGAEASYLFGRGVDADVRVADKRISSKHCRLFRNAAGGSLLQDLGSANGVFVRRPGRGMHRLQRLEVFPIKNGDEIIVLKLRRRDVGKVVQGKPFTYMFVRRDAPPLPQLRSQPRALPRQLQSLAKGQAKAASKPSANALGHLHGPALAPITVPGGHGAELRPSPVPDADVNAKYAFFAVLGRGACGVVYRATCRTTGRPCAVKAIKLQSFSGGPRATVQTLAREAELLQQLDHPSIIQLYEVLTGAAHLYLVMELVGGGDLFDRVVERQHLSEAAARGLTRNLLESVAYLHAHHVVHRDLKLENILMVSRTEDVEMKLTDFGLAAQLNTDGLRTFCGTPQYFAPEVLRRRNTMHGLGRYGREADMWSVGVILYILLCGAPPFRADQLERQIATGELHFKSPAWLQVSAAAMDLVRKLIEVNPKRRLSAADALGHPWITGAELVEEKPAVDASQGDAAAAVAEAADGEGPENSGHSGKTDHAPGAKAAQKRKRSYECERLESWRTRFTSMGGREGLVRPVASPCAKDRLAAKRRRTGP